MDAGLSAFPLGKEILKTKRKNLAFTPDLSILRILDETAKTLCSARPKNREAFRSAFEGKQGNGLNAPWGVSIFELKRGEIHFAKTLGSTR